MTMSATSDVAASPIEDSAPSLPSAPAQALPAEEADLIIRPRKGWIGVDWRELVRYRELLLFLVWRDVKVKYKQAVLGFAWAIIVPVLQVIIFTMIGKAAGFANRVTTVLTLNNGTEIRGVVQEQTAGAYTIKPDRADAQQVAKSDVARVKTIPYAVFVYAGLLPWLFLQAAITNGGLSLINQQALLGKIYLPRLFVPAATVGGAFVDMWLSAIVFVGMLGLYRFAPASGVWFVPVLAVMTLVAALAFAFTLSALTINFRDMRFLIPFFAQIMMWLSAAVYPAKIFGHYEKWLAINPVYGLISGYRSALLGEPWHAAAMGIAAVEIVALFLFGLFYFRRAERRFADIA
jgi:lipopolysaccharide transport system permease protein